MLPLGSLAPKSLAPSGQFWDVTHLVLQHLSKGGILSHPWKKLDTSPFSHPAEESRMEGGPEMGINRYVSKGKQPPADKQASFPTTALG